MKTLNSLMVTATLVALALLITLRTGAAQESDGNRPWGPYFVSKDGKWTPVETECMAGTKCDKDWLSVQYPVFAGGRPRVVIDRPTVDVGGGAPNWASGAPDLVAKALMDTHRFHIVDGGTADYTVTVTINGGQIENHNSAAGALAGSMLGIGGLGSTKQTIEMTVRIVDVKSNEVVSVETVQGSASVRNWDLAGIGGRAGAGMSSWKTPSAAAAATVCAEKAAVVIVNAVGRS